MARDFELDISQLDSLIRQSPEVAYKGAKRGLQDSLRDWVKEARDIAPLDKGTLRRGIRNGRVSGTELQTLEADIISTAIERNFNYAYYIHEKDAGGKNLRTPGTEKKYLDKSGEDNEAKWLRWIEEEIRTELAREGW
jgi:hypothetical protein